MKYAYLLSLLVLVACGKKDEQSAGGHTAEASAAKPPAFKLYALDSSKLKTIAPGLKMYIVQEGSGEVPKNGQTIITHYHGTFLDGNKFDGSFERGEPLSFVLGQGGVIKGWDLAFAAMRVGTKAVLIISPELAYGERGHPAGIPPNATLRFDVELLGANTQ